MRGSGGKMNESKNLGMPVPKISVLLNHIKEKIKIYLVLKIWMPSLMEPKR